MSDIVEQALRVLSEHVDIGDKCSCGFLDVGNMEHHQAQALADAGLLRETERTVPTREQLAEALARGYEPEEATPNRHDYRAADAVLALLTDAGVLREPERAVPTTEEVLNLAEWAVLQSPNPERFGDIKAGLHRWLQGVKAEAWDEGNNATYCGYECNPYK